MSQYIRPVRPREIIWGIMLSRMSWITTVPSANCSGVVAPISVAIMPPTDIRPTMPQTYMSFSMRSPP